MKRKIYELFVPNSIKNKLYLLHINQFLSEERIKRSLLEESLPNADLSSCYIRDLTVVSNLNEMLLRLPKSSVVVEVGSGSGAFSQKILSVALPQKLYMIESWSRTMNTSIDIIRNKFRTEIFRNQVEIIDEQHSTGLQSIADESIDWVFLNTDHSFLGTKTLLEISRRKVKQDGYIAGNKYTLGNWVSQERYGVIEAVNTFCKNFGWEMILLTHEHDRNLYYAIKRITNTMPS